MTEQQFDILVEKTLKYLALDSKQHPERYRKSGEGFELRVKDALDHGIGALPLEVSVDYTPGGHGFPDMVIEDDEGRRYGIEVKSSSGAGKTWKINGNSVLGKTRAPDILKNVIIFGKVRGEESKFRAKEYKKCIADVVVTHSPRYLIDLDLEEGESFFDRSGLIYEDINCSDHPIQLITDYFSSIGQRAWWLADSAPAAIKMFGELKPDDQGRLMGYAYAHFPEIFSNSGTKFYRYASWLAAENSIVDPALRDHFTAGGKTDLRLGSVEYEKLPRIFKRLHDYRLYVLMELKNADLEKLEEDWGIAPSRNSQERIGQWLDMTGDVIPDRGLGQIDKRQMLKDILLDGT